MRATARIAESPGFVMLLAIDSNQTDSTALRNQRLYAHANRSSITWVKPLPISEYRSGCNASRENLVAMTACRCHSA